MNGKELILIVFGTILGFVLSMLAEYTRRVLDRRARRERGEQLLNAIVEEVELGISRCQTLIKNLNEKKLSFSRIYTALWNSTIVELSQYIFEYIKDPEILKFIHRIYYSFDLVNFNMEREKFDVGAAFARDHIVGIQNNLSNLQAKLGKKDTS